MERDCHPVRRLSPCLFSEVNEMKAGAETGPEREAGRRVAAAAGR